jgi:hypothetical protein
MYLTDAVRGEGAPLTVKRDLLQCQKRPTTEGAPRTVNNLSFSLSLTHSLTHTHTYTHTHSVCLSLSLTHSLTLTLSLSLSLSLSHTHTHTHTHSLLSPSLPLSTTRGPGAFSDENRIQLLFVPCEVPCLALRVQGSGFR